MVSSVHLPRQGSNFVPAWKVDARTLIFSAALLALAANAFLYIWHNCNPLLLLDDWFYLDVVVRKIFSGELSFIDFFAKQEHAQPLVMLLLYVNTIVFGMDFSYQGLFGLLCSIVTVLSIFLMVRREIPGAYSNWQVLACLLAIAAIFTSLNGSGTWEGVYDWSLQILGFASLHMLAAGLVWLTWRSLQTGHWLALLLGGAAVGIGTDDAAYIIIAACATCALLAGIRLGCLPRAIRVFATLLVALALARLFYYGLTHYYSYVSAEASRSAFFKLANLRQFLPEIGNLFVIPSASSIVHAGQLQYFFPQSWKSWQQALGLLLLAGQAWFWLTVFRTRLNGVVFMAVCMMLLAYGYWAGIIVGRLSVFGIATLSANRYVLFYMLMPTALLLMAIARLSIAGTGHREKATITTAAAALLVVQVPISLATWRLADNVDGFLQDQANKMFAIARDPGLEIPSCGGPYVFYECQWNEEKRAQMFQMMKTHRLSVFSREFNDRHDMYESDGK